MIKEMSLIFGERGVGYKRKKSKSPTTSDFWVKSRSNNLTITCKSFNKAI